MTEHVLRPSASATLATASSNKSLRSSTTPALAPVAPVKKPSPSPSIKRGKAEKLLKEHGSPPGMRVTAGGRIVPSDMPPALNNRFVNSTIKPPTLRGVPLTSAMVEQQRTDSSTVPRLEVIGSRPVLYLGDRAYALPALDATNANPSSLPSAPLGSAPKSSVPVPALSTQSSFNGASTAPPRVPTPLSTLDLSALRSQQTLKKQELRTVEQTEVLQASHQTDAWRAGIIEKKRNLIIELDALREQISALEATENNSVPSAQSHGFSTALGPEPASLPPTAFAPQFQQAMPSPLYGFQGTSSFPHMMMFPPPFGAYSSMQASESAAFVQNPVQIPHSPGSSSRRSHAIQIKAPPEEKKKKPVLDPKSPTYEPVMKPISMAKEIVPNTPSPNKQRSPWRVNGITQSDQQGGRSLSQKPSLSSIDTTDFFPTNTHEHSSTRVAPQATQARSGTKETSIVPSTPEKNWPASPWNEGNSGRSSHKTVSKLTSWPEAFGKRLSSGSGRQVTDAPLSATTHEREQFVPADSTQSILSSATSGRKVADSRFGTEDTWPLIGTKPVNHAPSTYQEGFQAGYDHVGIPDSPDVLKGYIQGLLQFLHDESKKGRNNSLRGLVTNSQPHDSAISMTFNHAEPHINNRENIHSGRLHPNVDVRRDAAHPMHDSPLVYTLRNEANQEQRLRNTTPNAYMNTASASDRVSPGYQQTEIRSTENSATKKDVEKGSMVQAEAMILDPTLRQFSGNQLGNRHYGTPMPLQRYDTTQKDQGAKYFGEDVAYRTRPMANQRVSGLDGAMDDLAGLVCDTHISEQAHAEPQPPVPAPTAEAQISTGTSRSVASIEEDVSCFRPSSSKGKQKATPSPVKSTPDERSDVAAPSRSDTPGSPKKSGEHSPAKAKLEQVTNKFRRKGSKGKKKDARNLSPEQKKERAKKWRERFGQLRDEEEKNVHDHRKAQAALGERS